MLIILPTDIYGQTKCEFKLCYLKDGQYFDEKQDRNHWCRAQNFLLVSGGAINFNCWITLYRDEDMICQIVCTCYMKLNSNFKKGKYKQCKGISIDWIKQMLVRIKSLPRVVLFHRWQFSDIFQPKHKLNLKKLKFIHKYFVCCLFYCACGLFNCVLMRCKK